jgi:hypothetical protein
LIGQQPDLIFQFGDALLVLGESRFDECLDGRRHLGLDLRRDPKPAGALLGCHVPMTAGTAGLKINTSFQHLPVNGYAWVPQGASVFMRFLFLFAELNCLSTWFKAKN